MMPINHAAMNSIYPCRTQKEQKLFERLPEIFHGRDQAFIPPFGEVLLNISQKHPRLIASTERFFLSLRGGMASR
jgi:hypothetical protein